MSNEVEILVLSESFFPEYTSEGAAGADVRAHLNEPIILRPGRSALVPTGIQVEIPSGYEIQVRPRSGLALKHQITVLNTPGTIDSDYRGEIKVILINHGSAPFEILPGMRIAQLVVAPVVRGRYIKVSELTTSHRGGAGFGSSGVN